MSISDNLKQLRTKYNLTQMEFGKIAGVTDKAVSSWEKGNSEPRMGALQRIANRFGINVIDIISDENTSSISQPNEVLLMNLYRQLNGEGQQRVIDYTEDLVSSGRYSEKNDHSEMVGKDA